MGELSTARRSRRTPGFVGLDLAIRGVLLTAITALASCGVGISAPSSTTTPSSSTRPAMERVEVGTGGTGFRLAAGKPFTPWGFNYDHDRQNRLLEDYWVDNWPDVESDFAEMKELGANVVRIYL